MSSETVALLVKFLPTILTAVCIFLCMLRGFLRGFRKSVILLIHYIISLAAGLFVYFEATKIVLSDELNSILASISPEFADANSLYDVVGILVNSYLPEFASLIGNEHLQQVVMALVGVGVSLVFGIVCLIIFPWVVRVVLYLLYLLFYREGKVKRHKEAEGDDYHAHRLMGTLVGVVRGFVWSVLLVSLFSSTFYIATGGISTNEEVEDLEILDQLEEMIGLEGISSSIGVEIDLNAIYEALKQSRSTGVGLLFDAIKINGTPIDLYYADLYLSSTFNTLPQAEGKLDEVFAYLSEDEAIKSELAKISIREELAMIVGLVEQVLESNAITIEEGTIVISPEILEVEIGLLVDEYISGSTLMSDLTPLAIVGLAEAINEGNLSAGDKAIDDLFDEETIELIKEVNIVKDLGKILKSAFKLVNKLPVFNDDGEFDLTVLQDVNTYLNLDVDTVKEVFADFGQIDTLTKVVFPVGIGFALSNYSDMISSVGINPTDLDFTDVDWGFELTNLGNIYEGVISLGLDLDKLLDSTTNEETGLTNQIEYIIDLVSNEETSPVFKENLISLVDTIFESELFSQVGLVFVKSKIAEFELAQDDEVLATLNDSLNLVKQNLENYTEKNLRDDLHELISSGLNVTSLLPLFMGNMEEINIFELLYEIPTEDVKKALLGTYNEDLGKYQGGIYSLRLLTGDLNNDGNTDPGCFYAADSFVEAALKAYATDLISAEVVDSITSVKDSDGNLVKLNPTDPGYNFNAWPNEIEALIDAISDLQTVEALKEINLNFEGEVNITEILPESLTYSDIDVITAAASRSKLLSAIIKDTLVNALKEEEMIGDAIDDPNIVWMDTFGDDGEVVSYGELNALLKGFKVLSEEDKAINLNNPDTLVNGLGLLIREATSEELNDPTKQYLILNGLNYEDVMPFTNSQVVMKLLSTVISSLGEGEESLAIVLPSELKTSGEGNEDNWKNWAMDHNGDYKQGEFSKLILIMYHAREYALNNPTEVVIPTTEEENAPVLTISNLLKSVVMMDKDELVTDSLVLYSTVSSIIMSLAEVDEPVIIVPTNARQDGEIVIIKEEIHKLLAVVRDLEISLENNDFSNIDVDAIVDKLEEARESISLSNIFSATIINILSSAEALVVPREYQKINEGGRLVVNLDHPIWYSSQLSDWEDSEVAKLLASITELSLEIEDGELVIPDDPTELLKGLNDASITADPSKNLSKLDVIYSSVLLRTTVSDIVYKTQDILYREEALVSEDFMVSETSDKNISKDEIRKLITLLEKIDITFEEDGSFDAGKVIESLNEEEIRELIVDSNILNITLVNMLVKIEGIHIPANFKTDGVADPYIKAWYPSETLNWDECELGKLLSSVVELELEVVDDEIELPENPTDLLKDLKNDSITNKTEGTTKLDVIYSSEVIKQTLKVTVEEIEEVKIRDEAYEGNNRDNYIAKVEVERLIDLANNDGIDFENIEVSVIFDLLKEESNRKLIVESNILNITIVSKFDGVDALEIPDKFMLDGKINALAPAWYPSSLGWQDCELARLLNSIVELDITVDEDDNIVMPETDELLRSLNDENENGQIKLDIVYSSEIIAKTISVKISEQEEIMIRDEAYQLDDEGNKTDILNSDEILHLVNFIELADISLEGGISVSKVFDSLNNDSVRQTIVESNILNITVVSKFDGVEDLDMPEELMIDGKVNVEADGWYPKDKWQDCELAHLLDGVVELGITVDEDDNIVIPETDDLLKSLNDTNEDGEVKLDVIYSSTIMSKTISNKITSQEGIMVRDEAYQTDNSDILAVDEIKLLVDFIEITEISLDDGISVSKVFNTLSDEEKGERTREIIVTSNILNITVVSKFDGVDGLSIPDKYLIDGKVNVDAEAWYSSSTSVYSLRSSWEDCELARLLNSIVELGITADEDDNIILPETDELLRSLNDENEEGQVKLDIVYASDIISNTISDKITSNEDIMVRDEAFCVDELGNKTEILYSNEILLLVNFIEEANISIDSGISISNVFDSLNSAMVREIIATSNILNITVVSKLDEADGLSIPAKFKSENRINVNAEEWYPSAEVNWDECELGKLLASIVELEIETENDNIIVPEASVLLTSLNDASLTNTSLTRLDVVYLSEIIKLTIKDKLEENDEVMIRSEAYDTENYIKQEEISLLVQFVNEGNIDLDEIKVSTIFDLLSVESNRKMIVESNILNVTVVSKFDGVAGLTIPNDYLLADGSIDTSASKWYKVNDWQDCELARLLNSVVELGITTDANDNIVMPETDELFKSLSDEKLDIVYASEIIANTISDKITSQEGIMIRNEAYLVDELGNKSDIISVDEVSLLVKFINTADISITDGISTAKVFDALNDISVRKIIVESNILNVTVVSKFDGVAGLTIPSDYLLAYGSINIEASKWYPVNDIEWQDCELARLLNSVVELGITTDSSDRIIMPETDSLLKSLNDENELGVTKLEVVYASEIIANTISDKITSQDGVMIRSDAFIVDELDNNTNILNADEILLLVDFIEMANISLGDDSNNLSAENIFDVIKDSEKGIEARIIIVTSNILNITVVSKFEDADGLELPSDYLLDSGDINVHAAKWYPTNDWQDCELARLLNTVVELDVKVENGVPKFENNVSKLLGSLNDDSITNSGVTKLDVVYLSDVIKQTLKVKLEENDEVLIRKEAYVNNDVDSYVEKDEIQLLVEFINTSELDLTSLDAGGLFNALDDAAKGNALRRIIVVSNILNITTVDKIAGDDVQTDASAIKFASLYLNSDNTVNKEASAWYPVDELNYENCELYHLLICVDELGITASGDSISISINDKLDMLLTSAKHGASGETKLDVAYLSDSIANTISYRLNEFADIPLYTYNNEKVFDETANRKASDRIISGKEVKALLAGLEALGMKFSNGSLAASDIENIALDKLVTNINGVLESSILHYIISTKLIEQTQADSSIVVYNYWSGSQTYADIEVVKVIGEGRYGEDGVYLYVHTSQITESIEVLDMIGINSFESISNINNIGSITGYFSVAISKGYTAERLVTDICESAIVSKIFSELLVTLPSLGFQGITPLDVVEVYDNDTVKAITVKDLKTLLAVYA